MTDEEKKETPPASKEEKGDDTEETDETKETSEKENKEESEETKESEESGKDEDLSKSPDYWKKIAQEEQEKREKAETALAGKRFKKSEARRKGDDAEDAEEEDEENDEEKPLTRTEFDAALRKERASIEQKVLAGETLRIARTLAESEDEASAIVAIYNGRVFPEHLTHEQKVTEAFYIAHGPRLSGKILELRRSLQSKATKKQSGSENVHRDAPHAGEPKISPQDKAEYDRLGYKWNGKQWEKKSAGGRVLIKDPKTGK